MTEKSTSKVAAVMPAPTRFFLVHGDKGGVGKSFVAQALANFLTDNKMPVAIIDADTQNPDVARMFSSSLPTARANIRDENGWMDVMDFVSKHPNHNIIMNTPAGIGEYMKEDLVSFAEFLRSQDIPIELELWWTMNADHDSVNLFGKAFETYGTHFKRVRVICNLHYSGGNEGAFMLWDESPLRTRLEKAGMKTIFFPGLHIRVVKKLIDPKKVMPFSHAVDVAVGEEIGFENSERFKLQRWISDIKSRFAPAFADPEPAK
jgi:hypothetical protein